MLLTVDIGNTSIAFGIFDKRSKIKSSFSLETRYGRSKDEYHSHVQNCLTFDGIKEGKIKDIIVSSVVPQIRYEFDEYCRKYLGKEPLHVGDNVKKLGVEILLDRPEEVGSDRLVNAISAHNRYPESNIIIVDFGTATTFDVINKKGSYLGGMISPGVDLSVSALQKAASKLPEISVRKPESAIGKDTKSAMQAGIFYGYMGLIEKNISEIKNELDGDSKVISTGGLASFFSASSAIDEVAESLTLQGLDIIYRKLSKK